jgi:hypothetical protein
MVSIYIFCLYYQHIYEYSVCIVDARYAMVYIYVET